MWVIKAGKTYVKTLLIKTVYIELVSVIST